MTTFESSATMFAVTAIAFILVIGIVTVVNKLKDIISWQKSIWQELRSIRVNVADTAEYTHNHIAPDIERVSYGILVLKAYFNSLLERLDYITDERSVYKQPTSVNGTPCYAPDNTRKWDCINCPKRSTCGTLLTPTNKVKEA